MFASVAVSKKVVFLICVENIYVRACILMCKCVNCVCFARQKGSIRGSGHGAQTQVTEGKVGEDLLEVGGSRVVTSPAHVCWCDISLHVCLKAYGTV